MLPSKLNNIIIVDTDAERAAEAQSYVSRHAEGTEVIHMDPIQIEEARHQFETRIRALLTEKKDVMAIFNSIAATRGGILETLRSVEAEAGKGTRRIMLSGLSAHRINREFEQRGSDRTGFRHIRYDTDSMRPQYPEALSKLFNPLST